MQTAATKLTKLTNLYPQKATSAEEATVSATASASATAGTYNLEVSQLAKAQSVAAAAVPSADDTIGTGTLTITLGGYDSGTNTFTA
ncbi:MAG: hypothetical protein HC848_10100 [Limnobacter sp.]|nr:hypothetical protein [Limnobacter sp.]